jgi:hypothetical protein
MYTLQDSRSGILTTQVASFITEVVVLVIFTGAKLKVDSHRDRGNVVVILKFPLPPPADLQPFQGFCTACFAELLKFT